MFRRYTLIAFSFFVTYLAAAQNNTKPATTRIYSYVDEMPTPSYDPVSYVAKAIHCLDQPMPEDAAAIAKFVVNEDGHISDCVIVKNIDSTCNKEIISTINAMPAWAPGRKDGKPVKVYAMLRVQKEKVMSTPEAGQNKRTGRKKEVQAFKEKDVDEKPYALYDYEEYIASNIHYPEIAIAYRIEEPVSVKFIVNEDGHISDCRVAMSAGGGGLDKEALRVVSAMPPWQPGRINGMPVKVWKKVLVSFVLPAVVSLPERLPFTRYNLDKYISENLHYPPVNAKEKKSGKVTIRFIVNEDGSTTNFTVTNGLGPAYDAEALRVLKSMPSWIPGEDNGHVTKCFVTRSVEFDK